MKCCATPAPVMNHLRPCTTQRVAVARRACVCIIVGSEPPPGAGSVIDDRRAHACRRRSAAASAPSARSVADLVEHRHVAVVGRGAVEARPGRRASSSSPRSTPPCRRRRQAQPAALARHLRRPQAGRLRLGAHASRAASSADVLVLVEDSRGRPRAAGSRSRTNCAEPFAQAASTSGEKREVHVRVRGDVHATRARGRRRPTDGRLPVM